MPPLTEAQQELYDYLCSHINEKSYSPSIRQMQTAMGLKSPAPIQSRLMHLRKKGYIEWIEGRARTIQITTKLNRGLPIRGDIAAGGLIEPVTDEVEPLNLSELFLQPGLYALRVTGESMIEAFITQGDLAIMRPVKESDQVRNGTIVAARVEGRGNTLKYYHRQGSIVSLESANSDPIYKPISAQAEEVEIQGVLVGVWRGYNSYGMIDREW